MTEKVGPERILEVAGKLFAENGYSNVSIRDVCRGAGITPPMIYYYFGNKKGLFNAAVRSKLSMHEFIDLLRTRTNLREARDGISAFTETYLTEFPENAFDVGLYIRDTAKLDRESAETVSRQLDEVHQIAVSVIERGIDSGRFRRTDSAKSADCLIGMLNRVIFQRIHFSRSRDVQASRAFILDFFLRAMKRA